MDRILDKTFCGPIGLLLNMVLFNLYKGGLLFQYLKNMQKMMREKQQPSVDYFYDSISKMLILVSFLIYSEKLFYKT